MISFEHLLLAQTEKQLSILHDQSQYYSEWLRLERKLIDKFLAQDSFEKCEPTDVWEAASFHVNDGQGEIKGKWSNASGISLDDGLYLANRIVRCREVVTLRALAVEIKIDVKLAVNSEIWIVTRGVGVKDPNSAIIRVSKESEIDGVFIVFGSPIGPNSDFVFFKRQQIPEEKFDPNEEFTDLEIRIKDNGDDRIYVSISLNTLQSTVFQTYCNKFIPSLIDNKVMIAGSGRNVLVKSVSVQQKERTSMGIIIEASKRQQCCEIS